MQKQSKKKNIDNLDLGLDDEDLGSDPLDMSDISDDSLLSLDFQEIKEFDIGEDADRGGEELGTKPSNLLDYAKGLLKRVQDKPVPDTEQAKAQKSVGKKKKASEDENAINKFKTRFHVIELMIEELENFGLDIKVIQDIIKESQKFFSAGDIEAAEILIKNSKIFASNLWLEHRMNLISTLISFIDTFILNQTELELDFKNANKYFSQAQEFLSERDLTLANKYIDNTIQKVNKSWNTGRKVKQKEAIKHARFWIKELEEFDLNLAEFEEIINNAEKAHNKNDYDQTELFLKRMMDSSGEEIQSIDLDVNQKEDFIQGIQSVYDIENFSILNEAISKAESMLLESQEKDRVQFQLNQLLSAYKIVFELKNKGLDSSKLNDLFSNAKESFEKGDYEASGVFVKKILGISKQMIGTKEGEGAVEEEGEIESLDTEVPGDEGEKEKPSKKIKQKIKAKPKKIDIDKLPPDIKKIYSAFHSLKKWINFIKSLEKTGEEIVNMDELYSKTETALNKEFYEEAEKYLIELQKLVNELKDKVLTTKAENTIETVFTICLEAHELGIDVNKAENILKSAEEHLKNKEYQTAIDEAIRSQQMMELVMEKHQNASDKLLKTKMSLKRVYKDKGKPKEFLRILKQAKLVLAANDYDTLNAISDFLSAQVKKVKAGKELDLNLITSFEKNITSMNELQASIDELSSTEIDPTEAQKLYNAAKSALIEQKYDEVTELIDKVHNIINKSGKSDELRKLRSNLNIVIEELRIIENNGFDVLDPKTKIEELKILIESVEIPQAEELVKELYNDISDLKNKSKEYEDNIKSVLEDLAEEINKAKSEKVDTKQAEDLLNYAKQRMKTNNYSEVEGILDQSHEMLESAIQAKYVDTVEEQLKSATEKRNSLSPDHPRTKDLNGLIDLASEKLQNNDPQASMDYLEQFFTHHKEIETLEEAERAEEQGEVEKEGEVVEEGEELGIGEEELEVEIEEKVEEPVPPETELDEIESEQLTSEVGAEVEGFDETLAEAPGTDYEPGEEENLDADAMASELEGELESEPEVTDELEETPQTPIEVELEPEEIERPIETDKPDEYTEPAGAIEAEETEVTEMKDETENRMAAVDGKGKRAQKLHFDSVKAEALFKEAFGFMEKDRRSIYGKEPPEVAEGPGRHSTSGYDTEQVTQPQPTSIREKARTEVRKERARGRDRPSPSPSPPPPPTTTSQRQERIPPREFTPKPGSRKYGPRRKEMFPPEREVAVDDSRAYFEENRDFPADDYSSDYDEVTDKDYTPYDLEDKTISEEEEHVPPALTRRRPGKGPGRARTAPNRRRTQELSIFDRMNKDNFEGRGRRNRVPEDQDIDEEFDMEPASRAAPETRKIGKGRSIREKRLESLKKEALKGLQDIQAIVTTTYDFGAPIQELEQLSEDALNAFDGGDYQDVLLYVDQTEELSIRLKIAYMDSLVSETQSSGENTDYLEHLVNEAENAYNNEKFKVGDEICRKFMMVVKELELEARTPKHSKIYCRYCGNALPADSTFCIVCGEKLW